MRYEGSIYRPPSEASSLIVQATVGCSHNRCRFCTMYKDKAFRIRSVDGIVEDLEWAQTQYGPAIEKVFLADGDALIMKTADLIAIMKKCQALFPRLKRTGIYASPDSILRKTNEELAELKEAGLGIAYLGIESGSDRILDWMEKGVTAEAMIEAGRKIKASGITLSAMVILGLGGTVFSMEHAKESARVCNAIQPDYLSLLTLMIENGSDIIPMLRSGEFAELSPREALMELREIIAGLELSGTELRSNHASNYVSINGRLPEDKERILGDIDRCVNDEGMRYSSWRRL